jgi:hypothetical protein
MPYLVADGATLRCSMGTQSSHLMLMGRPYTSDGAPLANVEDRMPMDNIQPFGNCTSLVNPEVAAHTNASGGALSPQPCRPPVFTLWQPGARFVYHTARDGRPVRALTGDSTCTCAYAGNVSITNPRTHAQIDERAEAHHQAAAQQQAAQEDATHRGHDANVSRTIK